MISCRRFSQPLLLKKVVPWSKSDILMKSLSALRGVLRESLQSDGCSNRSGGKSGKSTIANAWSVLSLILKKRSLYRFLSHFSMATGSDFTMLTIYPTPLPKLWDNSSCVKGKSLSCSFRNHTYHTQIVALPSRTWTSRLTTTMLRPVLM